MTLWYIAIDDDAAAAVTLEEPRTGTIAVPLFQNEEIARRYLDAIREAGIDYRIASVELPEKYLTGADMSETRVVAPMFLWKAAEKAFGIKDGEGELQRRLCAALVAVCAALAENPIVPSDADIEAWSSLPPVEGVPIMKEFAEWWQRRMFLEAKPEVPEAIRDLLEPYGEVFKLVVEIDGMSEPGNPSSIGDQVEMRDKIFGFIREAYRLGQQNPERK